MANQKNPFISNKVHKQIHFAKEERRAARLNSGLRLTETP